MGKALLRTRPPRNAQTAILKQTPADACAVVASGYPQQNRTPPLQAESSRGMHKRSTMPGWPGVAPPEAHAMTPEELEQRGADGELSAPTVELLCDEEIRKFAKDTFAKVTLEGDAVIRLKAKLYLKYAHPDVEALKKLMEAAEGVDGVKEKHAREYALQKIMASKSGHERKLKELEAQESVAVDDINKLKEKLGRNQNHEDEKRREMEAIETGDIADSYRSWREATEAYEKWLQDNGVKSIEQELTAARAEAAAPGQHNGPNFEKRCRDVLVDWLSHPSNTSDAAVDEGGANERLMLLANVTFPGVTLQNKATGEFDLMLVRVVEAAELGIEPQALADEVRKARQHQTMRNGNTSKSTQLVYVSPEAEAHIADEVLPVEVVAVVECKNGAKAILSHIISMERGLSFFSAPSSRSASDGELAELPRFGSGVVQLKDGGPSLLFTPESFRCFRPEKGSPDAHDGHRPKCSLSRLFYMTEEGRLGPMNSIGDMVVKEMMEEKAFDTEGNVLRVPAKMAKLIAQRQEGVKSAALRGSRLIWSLVQHGNLWMLPAKMPILANDDGITAVPPALHFLEQ